MQVLSWDNPIGWALFLMSIGATVVMLCVALRLLSTIPMPGAKPTNSRKK